MPMSEARPVAHALLCAGAVIGVFMAVALSRFRRITLG